MDKMEEEKKEEIKQEVKAAPVKTPDLTEKVRTNPWTVSTFILGILVIILLITTFSGTILTGNVVSKDKIGGLVVDFFNTKLSQTPGTLNSINEISGVYQVMINMSGKVVPLYFTKDGNFIQQGYDLIPIIEKTSATNTDTQTTIPKTEKPSVELYVMSFCPYGNEAEKTMQPVYDLLKDKVDWNVHFIVGVSGTAVNSLHGEKEVTEDEREACVIKNYDVGTWFTFANYVNNNCGSNGSCWQDAAKAANVDVNKINSCVTSEGLDLMKAEETASNAAGATGSPTFIINGVESNAIYQYGNSEAYKGAICAAFSTVPTQCSQKLTSTSTAASGNCATA